MTKFAICLCGLIALLGCSHDESNVVGTWKSKSAILVFKDYKTWNIVGLSFDSGTWIQVGSVVTITPQKIKDETRDDYMKNLKASKEDQLEGLQKIEKAFSPVNLTLDAGGTILRDKSGKLGDLTRQKS